MILATYTLYQMIFVVLLLFFCGFLDVSITFLMLWRTRDMYQKYKPAEEKNDWAKHEMNPIVRFFMNRFGLETAWIVSYPLVFALLGYLAYAKLSIFFYMWMLGMYSCVLMYHYHYFRSLKKEEEKVKGQMEMRILNQQLIQRVNQQDQRVAQQERQIYELQTQIRYQR